MFFDPTLKPEVKTEPTVEEAAAKVLNEAADYLLTHGWTRGALRRPSGQVCMLGALVYSQDLHLMDVFGDDTDVAQYLFEKRNPACKKAWQALKCVTGNPVNWNDCNAREMAQVIDMLRGTAKGLPGMAAHLK